MNTWNIAADFFQDADAVWLDDFIRDDSIEFHKILPPTHTIDWHHGKSTRTSLRKWVNTLWQAHHAFRGNPYGIVTCFPQLAICTALIKSVTGRRTQLVAYNFNLGSLSGGARRWLATMVARSIDVFVVHSPSEIPIYSEYLKVPSNHFTFVPLQRGNTEVERSEESVCPYILSMGSAQRDYETLIAAVSKEKIRTIIVTRPDIIDKLPHSNVVEYRSGLTRHQCLELLAQARLSIVPVRNMKTASGQITFINSMRLGVAVIATRCPGTDGYVKDGVTGILVEPFNVENMRAAITKLWTDPAARETLAQQGKDYAENNFSDRGAARELHKILLLLHN